MMTAFAVLIVPKALIGTSISCFFTFHCSNGPYWNIPLPFFHLSLFQCPLLEQPLDVFSPFIVPMALIGTSLSLFFTFHCSNGPYWNIPLPFFHLSLFQWPLLEHPLAVFLPFIVPMAPIGTSISRFFTFHCSNGPYWNIQQRFLKTQKTAPIKGRFNPIYSALKFKSKFSGRSSGRISSSGTKTSMCLNRFSNSAGRLPPYSPSRFSWTVSFAWILMRFACV
jgi:hypothetical protein